ncbi:MULTISPECIES: pilin [Micromonospora]|uniref:pilin n=1 Tax=Micromonospora TaxID=1873 RepID=UPI001E477FC3|nr:MULTISPECIES: pilin [unclassified Micromonospora]MDI5939159.1 pilin [Micromonospora sp. DH15]
MHTTLVVLPDLAAAGQPLAANSISQVISNITDWIMGIIALVATMFLVIGGLRYMAAGGDPAQVEQAKGKLKSALSRRCPAAKPTPAGWSARQPGRSRTGQPSPAEAQWHRRPPEAEPGRVFALEKRQAGQQEQATHRSGQEVVSWRWPQKDDVVCLVA